LLVTLPALVVLSCLLWPETMYRGFAWPYFWGPVVADAVGYAPQEPYVRYGVATYAGYNLVNSAAWGILFVLGFLTLAQWLRTERVAMDAKMVLALSTWVAAGCLAHVLEDTGLLRPPSQYVLITPLVYVAFGALGFSSLAAGLRLERAARAGAPEAARATALRGVTMGLVVATLAVVVLPRVAPNQVMVAVAWAPVVLGTVLTWVALYTLWARRTPRAQHVVLAFGAWTAWVAGAYLAQYVIAPWPDVGGSHGHPQPLALLAPLLAAGTVAALAAAVWWRARADPASPLRPAFLTPLPLLIVFFAALDGFTTVLAVDFLGHQEKHFLPRAAGDLASGAAASLGWSFGALHPMLIGFLPAKLGVMAGVIVLLRLRYRDEALRHPAFYGLVHFALLLDGMGPGLRGAVRLALGV
jgi:uncharacterized membrane protein